MTSSELEKTETATEDEEKEEADETEDEAGKSGRFSVEKSPKTSPSGEEGSRPGTTSKTPTSKGKSSRTGTTKTATATGYESPPTSTISSAPTYITVPSSAGTPTYVYVVPYKESGESSATSSQLSTVLSNLTKTTVSSVSQAVKTQVATTCNAVVQATCNSAQRAICGTVRLANGTECPIQEECLPIQECYEDIKEKFFEVFSYDSLRDMWEKIWDGFLIMGGGFDIASERVKACRD